MRAGLVKKNLQNGSFPLSLPEAQADFSLFTVGTWGLLEIKLIKAWGSPDDWAPCRFSLSLVLTEPPAVPPASSAPWGGFCSAEPQFLAFACWSLGFRGSGLLGDRSIS